MNEKEQLKAMKIMSRVYDMKMSKFQTLFLTQIAIRRFDVERKNKPESLETTVGKVMKKMPQLCLKTDGLRHKRIMETSTKKALEQLTEEIFEADIEENLLRGDALENVIAYLLED